jgi:hypothetical protein
MIRYALRCEAGHGFEAWFSSSDDYDMQAARGLVECPVCGSTEVGKQIMAPAVRTSTKPERMINGAPDVADIARRVQAHIRANFDYVGDRFAAEARAMHAGEKPQALIYGEATPKERQALESEGVPALPLPDAFAPVPPKKAN